MSTNIIERVRRLVTDGGMSRSGLARASGLHANTLRDCTDADWNPTTETLRKLEAFLWDSDESPVLVPIEEIIDEARNGRMFILVDDEDRENEGDLVIPAQMATPDAINFMAMHGRGLICLAMAKARVDQLGLSPMASENRESMETAFTVSIEAKEGVTTGISAADRARTISVAVDASKGPADIVSPGHVFPLTARDGGVLVRAGHTEAAVDISRLAGLNPSGVICEIMNDDGTMARLDDLIPFARRHGMKIGTIADLIAYRHRNDSLVECVSDEPFQSDYGGDWRIKSYRNTVDGSINLVLQKGAVDPAGTTLVRMHAMSVFHDLLGQPGPRKRRLQRSMEAVGEAGAGLIVLLMPAMPGTAQTTPAATPAANGTGMDLRAYGIGAQ
ncbi:MAG: 3,4-dihydroxy-2-butanone-4-phosphate synthase, partial [Sphingopyxis sp.]